MQIIRDSSDELLIHCPATGARILGAVFILIGACLTLTVIAPWLEELFADLPAASHPRAWPLFGLGVFIAIPGIHALFKSRPTDFHFHAKGKKLVIRNGRQVKTILFSTIDKAEVYESGGNDEAPSYGLRLILRQRPHIVQISQLDSSSRQPKMELAERINRFLDAQGPEMEQ